MRFVLALALLPLLCAPAAGKEDPKAPQTPATRAADKVTAAFAAGDATALETLAKSDRPDPWIVVSELLRRSEHDAAAAFAAAGRRPATEKLPGYVASRRGKPENEDAHKAYAITARAIKTKRPQDGLAALPVPPVPTDSVIGVELAHQAGHLNMIMEQAAEAAEAHAVAGEAAEALGWLHRAGLTYTYAGRIEARRGNREKAFEHFERGLAAWESIGFGLGASAALFEMGHASRKAGLLQDAIGYYERSLRWAVKIGHTFMTAAMLQDLGLAYEAVGNLPRALEHHERALPLWEKLGKRDQVAASLINIGNTESSLANYPKAIEFYERGIAEARSVNHQEYISQGQINLAGVYWRIGNTPRALVYTEQALERMKSTGQLRGAGNAMVGLGLLRHDLGDHEGAMQMFSVALAQAELRANKTLKTEALMNIGRVQHAMNELAKAQASYERCRILADEIGDRILQARCTGAIGSILLDQGKRAEGLELLRQCEREARSLHARSLLVWCLTRLVNGHLETDPKQAMAFAREGRTEVEHLLGGLGADDAATVRGKYANLFEDGAQAAVRIGDTAEALTFLESGRAGALLESLGGRHALQWANLPEGLRKAEMRAKRRETTARAAFLRLGKSNDRKTVQAAARKLADAQARVEAVNDEIQRTVSRRTASLFYPRAATLEELQRMLAKDEALVIYGLGRRTALGVTLTSDAAKIVELGSADDIRRASEALVASDPLIDPSKALAGLKKLLVTPLALSKAVKRVLISPEGALCYVPFGVLFDRPVALTPSGTTQSLLKQEPMTHGAGVLALGNPTYGTVADKARRVYVRGRELLPLPSSGPEAKAVGDEVLLGEDANETQLRERLGTRERWRAVHFACHGLVDPEHPLLSSLALSSSKDEDGFLTALEVLRMEIPADLAVLSACETGRGKLVTGEGIVGLTRAFMYAGSPRVLCSLWKVDDEATMALMVKFYELWAPKESTPSGRSGSKGGMGAAEALREAQEHVRSHEKWKHPYYWAAWVLWGLAD